MFTNLFKSEAALKGNMKTDMAILFQQKIDELTANTNHETKEIVIHLHPEIKRIIEKLGDLKTKDYLFQCLSGIDNSIERKKSERYFCKESQ